VMALNAKLELLGRRRVGGFFTGVPHWFGGGRLGGSVKMPLLGIFLKRHELQNSNGMFEVT